MGFGRSTCSRYSLYDGKSAPQLIFTPSYGEPLILADLEDEYHSAIESDDNQRARAVVAELTTRIAKELSRLSINAPNWYALIAQLCASDLYECFLGMSFIQPRWLDVCCGQTGIFLSMTSLQFPKRKPGVLHSVIYIISRIILQPYFFVLADWFSDD